MGSLRILYLTDERPGHYHLSEGVTAALGRLLPVEVHKLAVSRRWIMAGRTLRFLGKSGLLSPERILQLGYGIEADTLPEADLVISAGGETLPANVAAARSAGIPNIFVGSLRRGVGGSDVSLVVSSYARHRDLPHHLVSLKPSAVDPEAIGRPAQIPSYGPHNPPALIGLLIGGDSGLFKYEDAEWRRLFELAREISSRWGSRWLVSTSRRTPPQIGEAAFDLAKEKDVVADFIDYKLAGPGSLTRIFGRADAIVCSEDSSTMISEAVWARLPVIGVSPRRHSFKPEEAEYRQLMRQENWARFLPIADASVDAVGDALSQITPLADNPLDRLAGDLRTRLPELFKDTR